MNPTDEITALRAQLETARGLLAEHIDRFGGPRGRSCALHIMPDGGLPARPSRGTRFQRFRR